MRFQTENKLKTTEGSNIIDPLVICRTINFTKTLNENIIEDGNLMSENGGKDEVLAERASLSKILITDKQPSITKKPSYRTLHISDSSHSLSKEGDLVEKNQSDYPSRNQALAKNQLTYVPEESPFLDIPQEQKQNTERYVEIRERKIKECHCGQNNTINVVEKSKQKYTDPTKKPKKKIRDCRCGQKNDADVVEKNLSSPESSVNCSKTSEHLQEVTTFNKKISTSYSDAKIGSNCPITNNVCVPVEAIHKDINLNPLSTDKEHKIDSAEITKEDFEEHSLDDDDDEIPTTKNKRANNSSFREILSIREMQVSQYIDYVPVNEEKINSSNSLSVTNLKSKISSMGREKLPKSHNSKMPKPIDIEQSSAVLESINNKDTKQADVRAESPLTLKASEITKMPSRVSVDLPLSKKPSECTQQQQQSNIPKRNNSIRTLNKNHYQVTEDDSIIEIHSNVDNKMPKSDLVPIRQRSQNRSSAGYTWGTTQEEGLSPDFWIYEPTHKVEFFVGVFVVVVTSFLYFMMYFWLYIMKMLAVAVLTFATEQFHATEREPITRYEAKHRSKDRIM